MKQITVLLAIVPITIWMVLSPAITISQEKPTTWEVYFSPHGGATDAIIRELNKAKSTILFQAYSFTSAPIAKALLNAHKRDPSLLSLIQEWEALWEITSKRFKDHQNSNSNWN